MARSKTRQHCTGNHKSQLRIIGGRWRSRKLEFTAAEGLRPTGDRMRETLFNWLAPMINEANCADLFAGSGALGLEALSRGAQHVDFIDNSATAISQINEHLATLEATGLATCHLESAKGYLTRDAKALDIVFIDPPFHCGLVLPTCLQLQASELLAPDALIYIETPAQETLAELSSHWNIHREKITGGVACRLYTTGAA
ncbi:MAG: 16S rRNA (guanine(966)-N(2))-methyltransferase RsmD [Halioglobus sp.]